MLSKCKILYTFLGAVFLWSDVHCMDLHLASWKSVKCDSEKYPMHKEVAELAAKARSKIKGIRDNSNISIIGITVEASDRSHHFSHFGILSSALNSDVSKSSDIDGVQVVTVPDMLRGDPVFAVMGTNSSEITRTHKLKAVLSHIGQKHKMYAQMPSIMEAINARIDSNQELDVIGTIGKKTSVQKNIGALLHCEQVTLLKILDSKWVLLPIVISLVEKVGKNEIKAISLDIFTYNDMCENCFSTCDKQFEQLKSAIVDVFKFAKRCVAPFDPGFNIYISSFRPYQSASTVTRRLEATYGKPCSQIFDRAFCAVGDDTSSDSRIMQFVNPWIFGYLIQSELNDIRTSVDTLSVDSLMKNIKDLDRLTEQYNDVKKLLDDKQKYILDKFGYDLVANHSSQLSEVKNSINAKREEVKNRAQMLINQLREGL